MSNTTNPANVRTIQFTHDQIEIIKTALLKQEKALMKLKHAIEEEMPSFENATAHAQIQYQADKIYSVYEIIQDGTADV